MSSSIEAAINRYFEQVFGVLSDNIRTQLQYLGVEAVNRIRDNRENWTDQTGNLRSSIGFAYYEDGKKLVESAFETVANGVEGSAKGKQLVAQLAQELTSTYALAVVAAMEYAEFVEAGGAVNRKPHDVLASTELWVRAEVENRLQIAIDDTIAKMQNVQIT